MEQEYNPRSSGGESEELPLHDYGRKALPDPIAYERLNQSINEAVAMVKPESRFACVQVSGKSAREVRLQHE